MAHKPIYPDVTVNLLGGDGNAFLILGKTQQAMQDMGVPKEEIDEYVRQATSGDYHHLLRTTMEYVNFQ